MQSRRLSAWLGRRKRRPSLRSRLWRIDRTADYGALNGVSKNVVATRLIETHWDDLLRVAGSLKLKTVRASTFIRALLAGQHASTLARAIGEVG